MRQLRKFLDLLHVERWLLARAFVAVGGARLGLWLLPFRILRPLITYLTHTASERSGGNEPGIDRVTWAVSVAARYVPQATCLTQALAAQALLAERGEMSELRFGVGRDERRGVIAHAWLESRGRVIIGGQSLERYLPLALVGEQDWQGYPATQNVGRPEVG